MTVSRSYHVTFDYIADHQQGSPSWVAGLVLGGWRLGLA